MQLIAPDQMESATAQPMGRVGFDIVRAMVQARQAATPTVIALIGAMRAPKEDGAAGTVRGAFAPGRVLLGMVHGVAGTAMESPEADSFGCDHVVRKGGERHA